MDSFDHNITSDTSSEMDSDLALKSFAEYSSDDSSDAVVVDVEFLNPISQIVGEVLIHKAKYNTSYASASNFANMLNNMPGAKLQIPMSKKELKDEVTMKFMFVHYVFCKSCDVLIKVREKCYMCNQETAKTKDNYFIYIPIKQQVELVLKNNLGKILDHLNQDQSGDDFNDFLSGNIYKREKAKKFDHILLPLTLNLDGAKIFRSSTSTLWPIQLFQNYLPPHIRFLSRNVLLVGLYCGKKKPNISTIMLPLVQEMNSIQSELIQIWHIWAHQ